jgi:hypothetical protein
MRLRKDINLGTLMALPTASSGWRANLDEQFAMLREQGYEGVQAWDGFDRIHHAGLLPLGMARATRPAELDEIARRHRDEGLDFTNLHLGTGFDSDDEMDALAGALLDAQARHNYALLVETHRATATQDIWRTLRWVERFPDLRFTADLSHWYTGHELIYGGEFESRAARLTPVLDRVRAFHGRIGNSGCMQTPLDRSGDYVAHYKALWSVACNGFLQHAADGDVLSFAPELLPHCVGEPPIWLHYQQTVPSSPTDPWQGEPCDRYADAEELWRLALECFNRARTDVHRAETRPN